MADTSIAPAPLSSISGSSNPEAAYAVKQNPKGGYSVAGNTVLDSTENAKLLANMEEMIKERQSPLNLLMSGLKDASAWGVPNTEGKKSEALRSRDEQKQLEAKDLFNMRSEMAARRSAQAMGEKQDATLDEMMGIGKQPAGVAGQPQGGQLTGPSGQPIPDLILKQMAQKRSIGDRAGAQAVLDDFIKTQTHKDIETYGRAESHSQEVKVYDKKTGTLTSVPAIEAMRNPNRYSYTPITGETQATPGDKVTGAPGATNLGNMRPVGQSTGFQPAVAPEQDLARIDANLKAYGDKGINTLSGVISRWAPPNENDTPALINNAAKFLGINPNQPIDLNNPAVRHLISTAIIKQEGNIPKVFGTSKAPAEMAPVAAANPFAAKPQTQSGPPASTGNRAQDLQNLETWKKATEKQAESNIDVASKELAEASTETGKRRAKTEELGGKIADETIEAADQAINIATNKPHVSGVGKGLINTPINAVLSMLPKQDMASAEDLMANTMLKKEDITARDQLKTVSQQLGIQYAADVFKGARMGIGLERMAAGAKGVNEHNTAESNIINAKVIRESAVFNKDKNKLWGQYQDVHGKNASFSEFEKTPQYGALKERTQIKLAKEFPQYFKPTDKDPETSASTPAPSTTGHKEGATSKSQSGREMVFKNGKWVYTK